MDIWGIGGETYLRQAGLSFFSGSQQYRLNLLGSELSHHDFAFRCGSPEVIQPLLDRVWPKSHCCTSYIKQNLCPKKKQIIPE